MYLWRSRCSTSWRGVAQLLLLVVVASLSFAGYIYHTSRLPSSAPQHRGSYGNVLNRNSRWDGQALEQDPRITNAVHKSGDCIPNRRELARRVMRAQREVEAVAGKLSGAMSPFLPHELRAIARELDPRVALKDSEGAEISSSKPPSLSNKSVCQEVFRGKDADPTYYHNFMQVQCGDVPPFQEVLTIILSTKGWNKERVQTVVQNIKKYYAVNVVLLTYGSGGHLGTVGMEGVTVQGSSTDTLTSSAINKAVAKVKTPFVLLADSLTHFTGEVVSLERLVRVLDEEGQAAAAAGSYRTLDGTWSHGCLQRRIENYQLAYVSGYEHSRHDCMFCDDVLGPFVARTSLLQKVPLKDDLEHPASLRDWFINVRLAGSLAVVCPDVMFFVDEPPTMARQDWLGVSTKWAVQYVWPHDGDKLEFTCEELKMECVNIMKMVASFLVPPCCRKALRHELGLVQECGEELGLYVELMAGSLLGAVKTDGILPWDFDMDVLGDCKDQEIWMKKGTECMARKGCSAVHVQGNYWITTCNVSFVDVSCRPDRLKKLPPELRNVPTRIKFSGRMATVPPNPALVARNTYGPNYLRHEVHWRYTGKDKGLWNRCLAPGFHACLEKYPTDGNIKFMGFPQQIVGL